MMLVVKNLPANAEDIRDTGWNKYAKVSDSKVKCESVSC